MPRLLPVSRRAFIALIVPCVLTMTARAQEPHAAPGASPEYEERVEVVGVTPIHGTGLPTHLVPSNVQVLRTDALPLPSVDVAALVGARGASVHLAEVQGGAFQPDLFFRGFGASPLLGASEGLAVYQDGVRMNDPFGDTVHWDVLPASAIASVNVLPGSNPLFGLNALGGALSIQTKDGFSSPGGGASFTTGSFGRQRMEAAWGGHSDRVAYYAAGSLLHERGWRDFSPSSVRRFFGDVSWRGGGHLLALSLTAASNDLTGNGAAPEALLRAHRHAVFTHPDETDNDLALVTVRAQRALSRSAVLEGVAYIRRSRIATLNGDLEDDGGSGDGMEGVINVSRTRSRSAGATAQVRRSGDLLGRGNLFVAGLGVDAARTRFGFDAEEADLTPDRGAIGTGESIGDARVDLRSSVATGSAFVTNTWSISPVVALTASARVNATSVRLRDLIGTALTGDHHFRRLNPAAGVTVQVARWLNTYGGYTESSRVPTPVELTCADPEDPCRLPNAFVSDPPLRQVVGRTWEAGVRGGTRGLRWTLAAFRTASTDDIVFVSSGTVRAEGHFENIPRTSRRGVEASIGMPAEGRRISVSGAYTYQQAVFGSALTVASPAHPLARAGEIEVRRGDPIPGVPRHLARVAIATGLSERLRASLRARAQSSQTLRGDEAALLAPVPGFAVADADLRWQASRRIALVFQVENVLDHRFHTFGVVADPSPLVDGARRFYSPGMPRAAWLGLDLRF